MILEHRGLAKLKSTYTDKLPEMVNPVTGRVHTSYHQAVAATGRLSSSRPQSAEHPHPQRGRAADPPGLHRRPGLPAARRRLLPDRAAHHGPPLRGRAACWPPSPPVRTSTAPPPPRSSAWPLDAGHRRPAPLRQGHQFRAHLWHVRLRPGAPARHRARRGPGVRGSLFQPLPRGERTSWTASASRRARTSMSRPCSVGASISGHRPLQPGPPRRGRTHRHQCPHAGYGRRHHQAGHDRRGRLDPDRAARRCA